MKGFDVMWDAPQALLTTRVRRALSLEEVAEYEDVLARTIGAIAPGTSFLWLSDAMGYEPFADRAAHARYRSILPKMLAEHGFRASLLDLFDAEVVITSARGVICRAIAHVHHDAEKIAIFDERFGRHNERYFSNEEVARMWLLER
jgi:hypothetical protein